MAGGVAGAGRVKPRDRPSCPDPGAGLAPRETERADCHRWLFFAAGPVERAITAKAMGWEMPEVREGMAGFGWGLACGAMPKREAFTAYSERCEAREAYRTAREIDEALQEQAKS